MFGKTMELSTDKTKIMEISGKREWYLNITVNYKNLEKVEQFKCWVSLITYEINFRSEIKARIHIANIIFHKKENLIITRLNDSLKKKKDWELCLQCGNV